MRLQNWLSLSRASVCAVMLGFCVPATLNAEPSLGELQQQTYGSFRCELVHSSNAKGFSEELFRDAKEALVTDYDPLSLRAFGPRFKHGEYFMDADYRHTQIGSGKRKYSGEIHLKWGHQKGDSSSVFVRVPFGEIAHIKFSFVEDQSKQYDVYCRYTGSFIPEQ